MKKAPYHVVKEAVEYAKKTEGRYVAGFVNAILRRYLREYLGDNEKDALGPQLIKYLQVLKNIKTNTQRLAVMHSFPEWLIKRWVQRLGERETEELCAALNKSPDFALRVDTTKMTPEDALDYLEKKGIKARRGKFLNTALYVDRLAPLLKDHIFQQGFVHVQDEASQLAGIAVQPEKGDVILDACCGMGTKTRHIDELSHEHSNEIRIFSMDIQARKIKSLDKISYLINGDVLINPFKKNTFNKILLDAPCSSIGIIRKHPEIKWRLKENDIQANRRKQLALLKALWGCLKYNGCLIYSVCSFEPEETLGVIDGFKKENKFIVENPLPSLFNNAGWFLSMPHKTGLDGFFIAKLRKI